MAKKEIEAVPFFDGEEQKSSGFSNESWVAILATSEDKTEVFYYNPSKKSIPEIDDEDTPLTFEQFCEYVQEEKFPFSFGETESTVKPNFFSLGASSAEEDEDYDEESGKCWKVVVGKAAVLDIYQGGLNAETLKEKIKLTEGSVEDSVSDAVFNENDSIEYRKDPYKYHGVSRKDFM